MKALSLALALATGALIAAPAVVSAQPAAKVATNSPHGFRIGQRMPAQYTQSNKYAVLAPAEYSLPTPPLGLRWFLIDSTAYLVQDETDTILQFRAVTKAA